MRLPLTVLLLAICVRLGFGTEVSGFLRNVKANVSERVLAIRSKFHNLSDKIEAELKLTEAEETVLDDLLKHVRNVTKAKLSNMGDSIVDINEHSKGIAEALYQGDIKLSTEQAEEILDSIEHPGESRSKRQAFKDANYPNTLWNKGLYYFFDYSASKPYYFFDYSASDKVRKAFIDGARMWQESTCIDFYESRTAPNRVRVFAQDGCWSYVGKLRREQQDLSLGRGCEDASIAAHEIGHALGFFHTHSRHDRDKFITVNTRNIRHDWLDQFNLETTSTNDNYGITYDYGSIMHYGSTSSSMNRGPTMVPHDPVFIQTLGSYFISFYDKEMMNKHYGCLDKCASHSAQCKNGGFPHPRNCNKCICPSGYGGDFCDRRPDGCGRVLEAKTTAQTFKDVLGDTSKGQVKRDKMDVCNYWIQAPQGSRIEVTIKSLSQGATLDGCTYWGVEIKTQKDQKHTGYRFCAPQDKGTKLVSYGNLVPVITYNRFFETFVEIEYKIASGTEGSGPVEPPTQEETASTSMPTRPPTGPSHPNPPAGSCTDNDQCSQLQRHMNFCRDSFYPAFVKKELCPKTCGFC